MKNRIENFLQEYNLTAMNNVIAVGFSGGYDSMALLNILKELSNHYGFKLVAAHLNHNWRGEESLNELENCRKFCSDKNIEFYCETLDANEKHTETRARELRYKFFNRVIDKYNALALMTAHTKSDTAETLVYRLIKGTGIKGLQGIAPKLGKIYRPMLDISRTDIEQYCYEHNLIPNDDSSNYNNQYSRNYIRNEILPLMKKINPQAENAINNLSLLAYDNEQIVEEYIKSLNLFSGNKILTDRFKLLSARLQKRLIYNLYVEHDFEYSSERVENTLKFVLDNINSKSGKKYSICADFWLFVSKSYIEIIGKSSKSDLEIKIKKEGVYKFENYEFSIKVCDKCPATFPKDSDYIAYVQFNNGIDFTLRTRRNGDRIVPLGSKNPTKLKDYLINKNIPQHEKDSIILLCKDAEVLWVSGYGISKNIKVASKCTHVLTLKKIGGTLC